MTMTEARTVGLRGTAWVAVAVFTKAVRVNSAAATEPLSGGRGAIFSRPAVTTEERLGVQVLAVGTHADCQAAVEAHRAANGDLGAEYQVGEHPIGWAPTDSAPGAPVTAACVGCGKTLHDGTSYCQPCREKLWATSGWVPNSGDEG